MDFEVEQKFRVADTSVIEARLRGLGATIAEDVLQADRYFAHPARDFAATDEALRIRRVGQCGSIAYKGPKIDCATKTRREIEIPLPEGQQALSRCAELLEALGFSPVAEVRKRRRAASVCWRGAMIEAALDDVEDLGGFVELEIAAEETDIAEAQSKIASLAAQLGLSHNERRSYLELLLERQNSQITP
jgi:adenylate cyclase class 2